MELFYYIKKNDGSIHKMLVTINMQEFLNLRKRIIEECSLLTHHIEFDCLDNIEAKRKQSDEFHNVVVDYNNKAYVDNELVYSVSYDYRRYPYLVDLMDDTLNGNLFSLDAIINYKNVTNAEIRKYYDLVNDTLKINEVKKLSLPVVKNIESFFGESINDMLNHAEDKQKKLIKYKNKANNSYYALQK